MVEFNSLDLQAEIEISQRNLPHWFQVGAAMFVTFRTIDSLPRDVVLRMRRELEKWLAARHLPLQLAAAMVHGRRQHRHQVLQSLEPRLRAEFRRLSARAFHRSLDECHGACLLKQSELAQTVAEAIRFNNESKYDLDRFVVMPNHVHVLVQFREEGGLSIVRQSWMRYTARMINQAVKTPGAFWQPEPFDHIIRSAEQFAYLQDYTADNPRKANLKPGEYLYWQRPS